MDTLYSFRELMADGILSADSLGDGTQELTLRTPLERKYRVKIGAIKAAGWLSAPAPLHEWLGRFDELQWNLDFALDCAESRDA
jgi:hypothetical protein